MKFDIQDYSLGFLDTESQCFPYKNIRKYQAFN